MGSKKKKKKPSSATASAAADLSWDPDVHAHNQTWMYLFLKREVMSSFPDSKAVKMQQMAWWNPAASPAVRRIDAEKLAIELHRFFKDAMRRPYEDGFADGGFAAAITALADTLVVKDNVLPALAATVNDIFRFKDEEAA